MAKKSMLMRQRHREKAVKRYAKKRAELKELLRDPKTSDDDKLEAQKKLQKLPRDANPDSAAQSLRADGPPARLLSQVRLVAHEAARDHDARRDPGRSEG